MLKIFQTLTITLLLASLQSTLILFPSNAFAQTVEKVKGTKALLDLGDSPFRVGSEVVSVTVDGRKVGLLKITQIKGKKALADITKGTAAAGMTIIPKPAPKKRFADEPSLKQAEEKKNAPLKNIYGILFAYSLDTMTLSTISTSFTGNTAKFKGFFDYVWKEPFILRFAAGLDGFNVKSSVGNLAVQYFSGDGAIQWNFYKNKASRAYVDGGFSYQIPSSTSSSLSISATNNSVFSFGGGMVMPILEKTFMTFFAHYNYIVPSTGVTLNSIDLGCGLAW